MKDDLLAKYLTLFLVFQILFVQVISRFPLTIEKFYSNGIYKIIAGFYRIATSYIPFSIGDILYFIFILIAIKFIYIIFRDKLSEIRSYLLAIGGAISVLYFFFYGSWGLNYYRLPLAERLRIEQTNYTTEELSNYTKQTIHDINELHLKLTSNDSVSFKVPYSKKEILKKTKLGYDQISKKHPFLKYRHPSIKSSLLSTPLTYMGFSGYLNPFTGEAQVNSKPPKFSLLFTASHEVAHQLGYAAENEANFIGYLASTSHPDPYFKLSGKMVAARYLLAELHKRDVNEYQKISKTINYGILKKFKESREFWNQYENPFEPYFKKSYNVYLKANKQKSGIKSYNYMVDLLLHYTP